LGQVLIFGAENRLISFSATLHSSTPAPLATRRFSVQRIRFLLEKMAQRTPPQSLPSLHRLRKIAAMNPLPELLTRRSFLQL
jgi:hypothetical protein